MDRLHKYLIMAIAAVIYALLTEVLIKKIRKTIEARANVLSTKKSTE